MTNATTDGAQLTACSRVHELARMDRTGLMALYQSMLLSRRGWNRTTGTEACASWSRDQLIAGIRNWEDPR